MGPSMGLSQKEEEEEEKKAQNLETAGAPLRSS